MRDGYLMMIDESIINESGVSVTRFVHKDFLSLRQ